MPETPKMQTPPMGGHPNQGSRAEYVYGIDMVRFAAALLVTGFHLTWRDPAVADAMWSGWAGVQVFFVVSGFVIANSANNATPIAFIRSRLLRLYPAAWVCSVLCLVVLLLMPEPDANLARRFIASFALAPDGPYIASAYWTLPVEIAFYAAVFLLLLSGHFHRLPQFALALAAASSAYLGAYGLHVFGVLDLPFLEFEYGMLNMTLLRHGVFFALGIFLWLWSRGKLTRTGMAAALLALAAAPLEITARSVEFVARSPVPLNLADLWTGPLLIWGLSLLAIAASARWRADVAALPPSLLALLRLIGLATYPLYLLHEVVGGSAKALAMQAGASSMAGAVTGGALSIAVALLVAAVLEPAVRDRLRRLLDIPQAAFSGRPALSTLYRSGGTV
ncbi:acyltransferase family protein [Azospirillum sp. C340-1]|uniref:Acyltransferase family protein n=2 Tax=Azospirillum isscasi TaxID=3053926 RepID=A0ABU0WLQ5_9PROT|nr:acyltransferase family protein [Azospirillum isscasi]